MTKQRLFLERGLWLLLVFAALSAALFFARLADTRNRDANRQRLRNEALAAQQKTLLTQLETARETALPPAEIAALKRKGLTQPITQLRADLLKHPPHIPQQGVLGGTMGFHDADDVRFLGDGWVFAGFDDGHILGKALLRYEVSDSGKISWKLVGSVLD